MSLSLRAAVTSTQTTVDVTGTDELLEGDIRQIDSEQVLIRAAFYPAAQTAYQRLTVERGVEGTRKAAHAASATVTTPSTGGAANAEDVTYSPAVLGETQGQAVAEALAAKIAFIEPTTATPQQIVEALIAAGKMEAE